MYGQYTTTVCSLPTRLIGRSAEVIMPKVHANEYFPKSALSADSLRLQLLNVYACLEKYFGDLKWWPAETVDEVIIGAILVQNVAWKNVTTAIQRLQAAQLLSLHSIHVATIEEIEPCITSTLYYRMKAKKLKAFAAHVANTHAGDVLSMLGQPMDALRLELLTIYGIGEETADDIVLYAGQHPSFVIDAYTKRIFHRLGFVDPSVPYGVLRDWFMHYLPHDVSLFNQYHAMIDAVGHRYCSNKNPKCSDCPLHPMCARVGV